MAAKPVSFFSVGGSAPQKPQRFVPAQTTAAPAVGQRPAATPQPFQPQQRQHDSQQQQQQDLSRQQPPQQQHPHQQHQQRYSPPQNGLTSHQSSGSQNFPLPGNTSKPVPFNAVSAPSAAAPVAPVMHDPYGSQAKRPRLSAQQPPSQIRQLSPVPLASGNGSLERQPSLLAPQTPALSTPVPSPVPSTAASAPSTVPSPVPRGGPQAPLAPAAAAAVRATSDVDVGRAAAAHRTELEHMRREVLELRAAKARADAADIASRRRAEAAEASLKQAGDACARLKQELDARPPSASAAAPAAATAARAADFDNAASRHLRGAVSRRLWAKPLLSAEDHAVLVDGGRSGDGGYDVSVVAALQASAQEALQTLEACTGVRAVIGEVLGHRASLVALYAELLVPLVRLGRSTRQCAPEAVEASCAALLRLLQIEPPGVGGMHLSYAVFEPADVDAFEADVGGGASGRGDESAFSLVSSHGLHAAQHAWLVEATGLSREPVVSYAGVGDVWRAAALSTGRGGGGSDGAECRGAGADSACPTRVVCAGDPQGGIVGVLTSGLRELAATEPEAARTAALLVELLHRLVMPHESAALCPFPRTSCCLLRTVTAVHLLSDPAFRSFEEAAFRPSPPAAYRALQSGLFRIEADLLRVFPSLPTALPPSAQDIVAKYLPTHEQQRACTKASLVENAAKLLQRVCLCTHRAVLLLTPTLPFQVQLLAARFESGPASIANAVTESWATNDKTVPLVDSEYGRRRDTKLTHDAPTGPSRCPLTCCF